MRLGIAILAVMLVTIPAQSSQAGHCTNTPGGIRVAWSPDGRSLAASLLEAEGVCAKWGVAIWDGTGETRWLAAPKPFAGTTNVSWSPDSGRLVASSENHSADVAVLDARTGVQTTIANGMEATWSPDGRSIAYTDRDRTGLQLVSPDGTNARRIAAGQRPAWSGDSSRLSYHRQGSIFVVRADGTGEQRIAEGMYASWSPDGSWIAVARDGFTYLVRPDGSAERPIGAGTPVQWAPSGEELVVAGGTGVRVVSLDGAKSRKIAEDAEAAFDPRWERLATVLRAGRGAELYLSEPTGARPRRISGSLCALYTAPCVHGTDRADRLVGKQGRDVIFPGAGDDRIWGRGGDDRIDTGHGRDYVDAGAANDFVVTHGNNDVILGGPGRDLLFPGAGEDRVSGGAGRDTISVSGDGSTDDVSCGPGLDGVSADPGDRIAKDCETVRLR